MTSDDAMSRCSTCVEPLTTSSNPGSHAEQMACTGWLGTPPFRSCGDGHPDSPATASVGMVASPQLSHGCGRVSLSSRQTFCGRAAGPTRARRHQHSCGVGEGMATLSICRSEIRRPELDQDNTCVERIIASCLLNHIMRAKLILAVDNARPTCLRHR